MLFKILGLALLGALFLAMLRKRQRAPKTRMMDPQEILFSLATLCESVPATKPLDTSIDATHIHEDDWRQQELVPTADHQAVDTLLEEVRQSARTNRVGSGFRNIFVRREHPTPLRSLGISKENVIAAFGSPGPVRPLSIGPVGGAAGLVEGGFAFSVEGLGTLYGFAKDDVVEVLGVTSLESTILPARLEEIAAFSKKFEVELIDWIAERWLTATAPPSS